MALTKTDIIDLLYETLGLSKADSAGIVDSVLEIIKDELQSGNAVMISGFGKWSVRQKRARRGRNPQTGEAMTIAAKKVITFKPSSVIRKGIKGEES
ncbi:MAG: DNA-binding protein HU [Syntrophus sp. SKADARSKE-3]|nr:DNA-binding protein HU [Syntrophus sp. SKADARSKE-3]